MKHLRSLVLSLCLIFGCAFIGGSVEASGTNAPYQICAVSNSYQYGQRGAWISSGRSQTPVCYGTVIYRAVLGSGDDWVEIDAYRYTVIYK